MAQQHEFRASSETLANGVEVVQYVNATAFPSSKGSILDPGITNRALPAVNEPGALRSIRILAPLDEQRRANFMLQIMQGTSNLIGEIDAQTLSLRFAGPLPSDRSQNANPFAGVDTPAQVQPGGYAGVWRRKVSFDHPVSANATHLLVRVDVLPKIEGAPLAAGSRSLVIGADEAAVSSGLVVARASLADPVVLSLDESEWERWRHQYLYAGAAEMLTADGLLGNAALVEQRAVALLGGARAPRREQRCVNEFAHAVGSGIVEAAFGERGICMLDPLPPNPRAKNPVPSIDIVPSAGRRPENGMAAYEAVALEAQGVTLEGQADAFDEAMGIAFCNDGYVQSAESQQDACTVTDRDALSMLGKLSLNQLKTLRDQGGVLGNSAQVGTQALYTDNADLNRWLNADTQRAINAIDAAIGIANYSDEVRAEPTKPVKLNKKRQVLKVSCIGDDLAAEEQDEGGGLWSECINKGKALLNDSADRVAVTPHVQMHEGRTRYFLRGTSDFDRLARLFRNSGKSMPPGILAHEFDLHTRAMGYDQARAGDNLGIVFLNDPDLPSELARDRFAYGLEHIGRAGSGGGDDDGHGEDWRGLPGVSVNSLEMLTGVLMSAVTDPNAEYKQKRNRKGNLARTYTRFTFLHGNLLYVVSNIRIVLAQNGTIITAYPLKGARAQSLNM